MQHVESFHLSDTPLPGNTRHNIPRVAMEPLTDRKHHITTTHLPIPQLALLPSFPKAPHTVAEEGLGPSEETSSGQAAEEHPAAASRTHNGPQVALAREEVSMHRV